MLLWTEKVDVPRAFSQAVKKGQKVDKCISPSAIGMAPREVLTLKAQQYGIVLIFCDYDVLRFGGLTGEHDTGMLFYKEDREPNDSHLVFLVDNFGTEIEKCLVDKACVIVAALDYLLHHTLMGARRNSNKSNLGPIQSSVLVVWEWCSATGKDPVKERHAWQFFQRRVRLRLKRHKMGVPLGVRLNTQLSHDQFPHQQITAKTRKEN